MRRRDLCAPALWVAVSLALTAAPARSQQPATCAVSSETLHDAVAAVHEKQRNVGVAAALIRQGELIFEEQLGSADLEHAVPVTDETVFGVASLTKPVTAIAVLRLWSEGRLDLDAPVQRYLPDFPERPEGTLTPRLLATHRSGLPHPSGRTPELFATHYATAAEALDVFRDEPLVHAPGAKRTYSSSNYNLLAAIVEAAAGEPFTAWVTENVLRPAGLSHTRFDDVLAVIPHRSERYSFYHPWTYAESDTLYRVPTWDYSFNQGGGGLLSSAADLARLGGLLLRPGLLPPEAWELFFSDGWFGRTGDDKRRRLISTGSNPGVQAGLVVDPERGIAAAVLANTWGVGARSAEMVGLPMLLADLCAGESP